MRQMLFSFVLHLDAALKLLVSVPLSVIVEPDPYLDRMEKTPFNSHDIYKITYALCMRRRQSVVIFMLSLLLSGST